MTFRFEFTIGFKVRFEFTVWISKLWLVDITIKIMTIGSKKNMTVGRRHRFGGNCWSHYHNSRPIGDGDTMVGDNSVGSHQSHYFGSLGIGDIRQSHYFNNPPTGGSLFSGMVDDETNLAAFVGATILAVRPSDLHHKRLHWLSHRCW